MATLGGGTNLFRMWKTRADREKLQKGLSVLSECAAPPPPPPTMWFILSKSKVVHIEATPPHNFTYARMGCNLEVNDQEGDLGITVDGLMKTSAQGSAAEKKTISLFRIIGKASLERTASIVMNLYKSVTLVSLHLCKVLVTCVPKRT